MGLSEVASVCAWEVCDVSGLCGCVGVVGGGGAGGGAGGFMLGWVLWGGWGLCRLGWLWVEEVGDRSLVRVKSMVSGDDV